MFHIILQTRLAMKPRECEDDYSRVFSVDSKKKEVHRKGINHDGLGSITRDYTGKSELTGSLTS